MNLDNNISAVITGGASGVGRSLAFALGRRGAKIAVGDVDAAAMDAVAGELAAAGIEAIVEREIGGGTREVLEMKLPCIIGATKGLNEPRYPKFPDIMKAKKKEIKEIDFDQLGLDTAVDQTELLKLEAVPERTSAQIMQGSIREQVIELVRILKEDDKVL